MDESSHGSREIVRECDTLGTRRGTSPTWERWRYEVDDFLWYSQLWSGCVSDLKDAETGQRGYLLTGDASYLLPYQRGSAAAQNDILRVRALIHDDPAQQR